MIWAYLGCPTCWRPFPWGSPGLKAFPMAFPIPTGSGYLWDFSVKDLYITYKNIEKMQLPNFPTGFYHILPTKIPRNTYEHRTFCCQGTAWATVTRKAKYFLDSRGIGCMGSLFFESWSQWHIMASVNLEPAFPNSDESPRREFSRVIKCPHFSHHPTMDGISGL